MTATTHAFLGRDAECAWLVDVLARDGTALVTGEAGIGKSTLAREAVARSGRGLWAGGGFATLSRMPYLALTVALGTAVAGDPAEVARRVEAEVGDGVLLVDDLQWLDRDTLATLPLLVGRIALVATSREPDAGLGVALPDGSVTALRLAPLDRTDAEALAREVSPGIATLALGRVLSRAGGNPLLIEELARDGTESRTVARAITAHLAQASPGARHALRLLAVADRALARGSVAPHEAELVDLGLVARSGDLVAIRHAVIAEALLRELTDEELRAAHREVARHVDDEVSLALHLARAGDVDAAVAGAVEAAGRTGDSRTRAALLRIASEAAAGSGPLDLHLDAARAAFDVDDHAGGLAILEAAPGGEPEAEGLREGLLLAACHVLGRDADAEAIYARARQLPLDPSGRAAHQLAYERAVMLANRGSVADGIRVLDAHDAVAGQDDPGLRAAREHLRAVLRFFTGEETDPDGIRAWVDEALDGRLPAAPARAVNCHGVLLGVQGPAAALAFADRYVERLAAHGFDPVRLESERVQDLTFLGRPADAVVAADELLERPTTTWFIGWTWVQRAEALCQLGRLADAEEDLRRAGPLLSDEWAGRGEALTTAAHVALWAGRPRGAISAVDEALGIPSHYDGNYLIPGLIRAWAQTDLGIRPTPLPDASPSWASDAATAEWAALAAAADGRAAIRAFDGAADRWDGHHALRSLVCAWAAADAARHLAEPSAVDRLRAVLAASEDHGFAPLAAKVRRSLRLAGVRVARPVEPSPGRGLLTPRERDILELVAAGQSNIEIARRMGLGRPTVVHHLSSAMAKLGAESRAQAVTLAQEL